MLTGDASFLPASRAFFSLAMRASRRERCTVSAMGLSDPDLAVEERTPPKGVGANPFAVQASAAERTAMVDVQIFILFWFLV